MRLTIALGFVVFVGCSSNVKGIDDMGTGGGGDDQPSCGNGVIDLNEDCDDGPANGTLGDKCTNACQFACALDVNCDDGDACNGAETCVDHGCVAGTTADDGTSCGTSMVCNGGNCVDAHCGDGIVTAPEECDDGNPSDGDGCNSDCTFSCKSSDPARNCTPKDTCAGQGTCDDTTHTCTAGTPLGDGTMCGTGDDYCKMGMCTVPDCGNSVTEPGEDCDDGGLNGTKNDPCNASCDFACKNPATDCGAAPDCEMFQCTGHVCQAIADSTKNGMACGASGSGFVCKDGACAAATAVCGNGVVESGEDCDFGAQNGPNSGCEAVICKFSCTSAASCADGNACNGAETCDAVTATNGGTGKKCNAGTPEADGTVCDATKVCVNKVCQNSTCGDGVVDTRTENCDPPGSMSGGKTCDSHCHLIDCGDGRREDTEQCDDSNTTNLDGCDSACKFEQLQRANSLQMSFDTTFCPKNALGLMTKDDFSGQAQTKLQSSLDGGITDGTITIMMKFLGLDDLTGTKSNAAFALGFLHATPVAASGYNGNADMDWWYTTDVNSIDGNRNPKTSLNANIASGGKLLSDPGTIQLGLILAGSVATLTMKNTILKATSDEATVPGTSTGATPGHLTSENIDPAIKTFKALKGGSICGDITAASLQAVKLSSMFDGLCNEGYTMANGNSLLDVVVGGCTVIIVPAIRPTQPDGPAGTTVHLTMSSGKGAKVTGCTGGGGYPACLDVATYSSAFQFTTDRVIAK
jgi:cysteine-rich repeat protein